METIALKGRISSLAVRNGHSKMEADFIYLRERVELTETGIVESPLLQR